MVSIPLIDTRDMPEDPDEKEKWLLALCDALEAQAKAEKHPEDDATDANGNTKSDISGRDGGIKLDENKP